MTPLYDFLFADAAARPIAAACYVLTVVLYLGRKRLYARFPRACRSP